MAPRCCRFRLFLSELQASDLRRDKKLRRCLSHYLVQILRLCLRGHAVAGRLRVGVGVTPSGRISAIITG